MCVVLILAKDITRPIHGKVGLLHLPVQQVRLHGRMQGRGRVDGFERPRLPKARSPSPLNVLLFNLLKSIRITMKIKMRDA